ncbi:MAG: hypothetical protein WA058_00285 [Minisyncoccia bacterium]
MDKKSKILFVILFVLIAGSAGATYYRYVVQRDYTIEAEATCDPQIESCFVHICDSAAGEECTGDPATDTSYYKIIDRKAKNIPLCDPAAEGCGALTCPVGENDCTIILCDPTEVAGGDTCSG